MTGTDAPLPRAWSREVAAEHTRLLQVASKAAEPQECEQLGQQDPETGVRDCDLELRHDFCLCAEQQQMAERILNALKAAIA